MYLCHCFFQRGGTLYNGHGSTSTLEHFSLIDTLPLGGGLPCLPLLFYGGNFFLLWGFVLLLIFYCIYLMYVIMEGLDYSIHPYIVCVFHLSFWGRVFPMRFSLFLHFMRDFISLCTWVPNMA